MTSESPLAGTLLAFDVDGTILDSTGSLRPRTVDAIAAAVDAGAAAALATGRDWNAVVHLLEAIPAIDYAVCINGIEVWAADGTELYADALDPATTLLAIEAVRNAVPGISIGAGIGGKLIGEPPVAEAMPPVAEIVVVDDIVHGLGPDCRDLVLYHHDLVDDLDGFFATVAGVIPPGIEAAYTGLPMIELVPPGAGKDQGLARLAGHIGIERSQVVAFGDGMNDLAMLGWAGLGVAMGQAVGTVQEAADEVTAANDDDGVAQWIEARLRTS